MNLESTDGYVALRILCGVLFIPHVIGKFTAREAVFGFFTAAGFKPPAPFVYAAMVLEVVVAACLIFGIFTTLAAWAAATFLFIAAVAVLKVTEGKWLWNIGGAEYPVFWGLCCVIVALFRH